MSFPGFTELADRFGMAQDKEELPLIEAPPADAEWRTITPRPSESRRARLAESDGVIQASYGPLAYKAGAHWIVEHGDGEYSVVRADIFEKTYEPDGQGAYRKRGDVRLRYFRLPYNARIKTLEGVQRARAGDWIIEGVAGEIWPVRPGKARKTYTEI